MLLGTVDGLVNGNGHIATISEAEYHPTRGNATEPGFQMAW